MEFQTIINLFLRIGISSYFIASGFNLQSQTQQFKLLQNNMSNIGYHPSNLSIDIYSHLQICVGLAFLMRFNVSSYIGVIVYIFNCILTRNETSIQYIGISILMIGVILSQKNLSSSI